MEVRWVMSPASTFNKILAAPQIISNEFEMGPAANALVQQSPISKYLFLPDSSFPKRLVSSYRIVDRYRTYDPYGLTSYTVKAALTFKSG